MMTSPSVGSSSRGRRPQPMPRLGNISFSCSDCDLTFPTHQALGGHRKFHTKLLDPDLRKYLRRSRRKIPVNALPGIAKEIQKPQEEEEWHTVEVKISDQAKTGGSKASGAGKFIEFMETEKQKCLSAPMLVEAPVVIVNGTIKELDLTLHL